MTMMNKKKMMMMKIMMMMMKRMMVVGILMLWLCCCHGHEEDQKQEETTYQLSQRNIDVLIEFISRFAGETDGGGMSTGKEEERRERMSLKDAVDRLVTLKKAANTQCRASRFYSIDGKCNNLKHPFWGAASEPFARELPSRYADGKMTPRLYAKVMSGKSQPHTSQQPLPSAREVSTRCMQALGVEREGDLHPHLNQNLMQFGQFFSHDLALTPVMEGVDCCKSLDSNGFHPDSFKGEACYPITVPMYDRRFHDCIPFNRSLYRLDIFGKAQQLTSSTHFIDQSTVYGSTAEFFNSLRTFVNGTLRVSDGFLPQDNSQKCVLHAPLRGCPVAGDKRLSVFPGLTLTHVLFHLEHNRLARALQNRHPGWADDRLFQEARALVIAQTQHIIYHEYLPLILGKRVLKSFGLNRPARYDPDLNPSIINSFMAAAFRFGHSTINNQFQLRFQDSSSYEDLRSLFFRPDKLYHHDRPVMGEFMLSLMTHRKQNADARFAEGVTDWLFVGVDRPNVSSDLAARNIQRGRDHGLPPYLDFLNLALNHFRNDQRIMQLRLPVCAAGLYRSVEDLDLYLGGLSEVPLRGGVVGPSFAYLIGKQFKHLREGDRLFFDTIGSDAGLNEAQIQSIKRTSYSGLICRNLGLDRLPANAFRIPHSNKNPYVNCDSIPDLDFSLW